MRLKKVSWKNFKSYSNIMTELDFSDISSLNLIIGVNGTGKSSIAECITYLMYGKIENFTASEIPNRTNKNFYGKIELDCDGHNVVIERGLSPTIFTVTIDGSIVDTAGKTNVQDMLEEVYYRIPYSVFKNIIVLSINDFKSLVNLNPSDKRNIIDRIFGFTIFNEVLKKVKEDMKGIDGEISENSGSLRANNNSIERIISQVNELKTNMVSQDEIKKLALNIQETEEKEKKNEENIQKLEDTREKIKRETLEKSVDIKDAKKRIEEIDKKIKLIDSGRCPMCGSSLETDEFREEKENLLEERKSCEETIRLITDIVNESVRKVEILNKNITTFKGNSQRSNIIELKSDLKSKISANETKVDPLIETKKQIEDDIAKLTEEQNILSEKKLNYSILLKMLGEDGGIKQMIAKSYIKDLNNIIAQTIDFMNMSYSVVFDSNFNTTIMQNGSKVNYKTLSTGEKKRVDFATIISFVKLLKLQYGELNLLFIDELFSNIDIDGVDDMLQLLKDLCQELNLNIFLIHHARLENIMFDNVFETTKKDTFSHLNKC
jgi:DNA repair exonuclease SbcCD ATPase subunit